MWLTQSVWESLHRCHHTHEDSVSWRHVQKDQKRRIHLLISDSLWGTIPTNTERIRNTAESVQGRSWVTPCLLPELHEGEREWFKDSFETFSLRNCPKPQVENENWGPAVKSWCVTFIIHLGLFLRARFRWRYQVHSPCLWIPVSTTWCEGSIGRPTRLLHLAPLKCPSQSSIYLHSDVNWPQVNRCRWSIRWTVSWCFRNTFLQWFPPSRIFRFPSDPKTESPEFLPLSLSVQTESPSRFLVDGMKEPLGEFPELGGSRLTLLLQSHVVLSQVLDLHLENSLVLLLLVTKIKNKHQE